MRTEVPEVRRCCVYLPLRRGLLFWGYLHLVITAFMGSVGLCCWYENIIVIRGDFKMHQFDTTDAMILFIIFNVVISCLLIYGAHKKNHKILKIQYYSALVSVIGFTIILIADICDDLYAIWYYYGVRSFRFILGGSYFIVMSIFYVLLQLYVIVMVRSEVFKLKDDQQQMTFTNNAADANAKCSLYMNNEFKETTTSS